MEGFLYFLDEDNMQVTQGPWALPVLSLPMAWRDEVLRTKSVAGIALQAQLLSQAIDEVAMREPMRAQTIFDQKEHTHILAQQAQVNFAFKMMNSALKMGNSVSKMMNFALKMMKFVLKGQLRHSGCCGWDHREAAGQFYIKMMIFP